MARLTFEKQKSQGIIRGLLNYGSVLENFRAQYSSVHAAIQAATEASGKYRVPMFVYATGAGFIVDHHEPIEGTYYEVHADGSMTKGAAA